MFIGANIDAVKTAARYGISKDRAVNYKSDKQGTRGVCDTVAKAVCSHRANAPFGAEWSEDIAKDFCKRSAKK